MVDGGDQVRVEVLGPLRVLAPDGRDITPTGVLQRRLLALLVLHRGRVVAPDRAVDVLWPTQLPRDPAGALQNHLSRLRRELPGLIESVGSGYRLDPTAVDLDCDRLAAALSDGAVADPAAAAELDALLARWSGPAFPELEDVDDARAEATRLDELRLAAREVRAEQRLAEGTTDGLVAELSALAGAEPLRERPRALLMAALATTGRHAEALRVYDDFRRLLGDELGIEPSAALAAQHAALLRGDVPSPTAPLAPAAPAAPSAPPSAAPTRPTRPAPPTSPAAPTTAPAAFPGPAAAPVPPTGPPESADGWVPASHLPLPATSLVGRGRLAAEVVAMVGERRLVSLVGPGGVGKTRLLVEVGHLLRAARPDRPVVLCELATAADRESVVNVVAAALGIDTRPGVPLAERVATVLGDTALVVLADNCEHVLDPVADLVDRLLARCPHVTVVATSRERLRVAGEQVCPVPVLPVEGDDAPAVQLFLDRARAAVPGYAPSAGDLGTISEIVHRLDGLPLAIELAAARLHTHDLREVAAGLDHRFSLLDAGYRTSPRHASLRAAVSWSYGLLDEEQRRVFAALSVFAGPFTAADAAAVCDLDVEAAAAALAHLTERSLVMRAPDRRYVLLETLRAFGADQLVATGRHQEVGRRHAHHLLDWAQRADRRLLEPGERAIAEIDAAVPELHTALGWLLDHGEVTRAGRLVSSLRNYALLRLRPDVLAWAERVTAADPDDRSPVAAQVWVVAAYAAWTAGDVGECGARSARALAVAERAGRGLPPEVPLICGGFELFEGRLDAAIRWYDESIRLAAGDPGLRQFIEATQILALAYAGHPATAERSDALLAAVGTDTPHAAYAWYCAGEADLTAGDLQRAQARFARALEVAGRTGASFVTGLAGASGASIEARTGDPGHAAREFRRLIAHWRRAGMWSTQWTMLRSIAGLLARMGRPHDAAVLVGAVRSTGEGHRIFGADEVALADLDRRLRAALGDGTYDEALAAGALLDSDAAVEHALRAL